jgi:hypothetical protein
MSEGELPERPGGALTTEQHGLARERERRNPFTAEMRGEKPPYSYEVFDRVYNKLAGMMDDYPWKNWVYTELHEDDRADVRMVFRGFHTVAYDRLVLQWHFIVILLQGYWRFNELRRACPISVHCNINELRASATVVLGGTRKAILQDKFYEAATTTDPDTMNEFTPVDFAENQPFTRG